MIAQPWPACMEAVKPAIEQAARDVDRAGDVTIRELVGLPDVHDRAAEPLQVEQLGRPDLADAGPGGSNQVADGEAHGCMLAAAPRSVQCRRVRQSFPQVLSLRGCRDRRRPRPQRIRPALVGARPGCAKALEFRDGCCFIAVRTQSVDALRPRIGAQRRSRRRWRPIRYA